MKNDDGVKRLVKKLKEASPDWSDATAKAAAEGALSAQKGNGDGTEKQKNASCNNNKINNNVL